MSGEVTYSVAFGRDETRPFGIKYSFSYTEFGVIIDPSLDLNNPEVLACVKAALQEHPRHIEQDMTTNLLDPYEYSLVRSAGGLDELRVIPPAAAPHVPVSRQRFYERGGFVYLVRSASGFYKIGRTVDPDDRIASFRLTLPFEVEYEHLIQTDDMRGLEKELHRRFSAKRVRGEWFDLSESDVIYIKSL